MPISRISVNPEKVVKKIPRIIHQMWLDRKIIDNTSVPLRYDTLTFAQSWPLHHPNWSFTLWNAEKVDKLFEKYELRKWKSFFQTQILTHIEKCDFSRYALLYIYGGVYVDLDYHCHKNLEPLLENRDFAWAFEPHEHAVAHGKEAFVYNGFMASSPGHWIWPKLMDDIVENYTGSGSLNDVLINTGPERLAVFCKKNNILGEIYFIPTCSVIPYSYISDKYGNPGASTGCYPAEAYAWTEWRAGTNWVNPNAPHLEMAQDRNVAATIVMLIILCVIFASSVSIIIVARLRKKSLFDNLRK